MFVWQLPEERMAVLKGPFGGNNPFLPFLCPLELEGWPGWTGPSKASVRGGSGSGRVWLLPLALAWKALLPILRETGLPRAAAAAAAEARGRPGRSQGRGLAHRDRATAEAGAAIFHPSTARAAAREPHPRVVLRPRHSPAASLDSGPVRLESPNTVRLKLPRR